MAQDWDHGPPWESGLEHRQRGRKSGAALSVVIPVDARRAPSPPPVRLTEAEKELWTALIRSRRAGWYLGAEAILESYCRTVTQLHQVEKWLGRMGPDHKRFAEILRLRVALVGQLCSLAVKLKLTPSTRLDRRTPHTGLYPVG